MSGVGPQPQVDLWSRPFWDACREKRLILQCCDATGKFWFPPSPVSPYTGSEEWKWRAVSGRGVLWSFVVFHRAYFEGFRDSLPYTVAMVQLDEGPFLLTNLRPDGRGDLPIGTRLSVVFEERHVDFTLPQFAVEERRTS
jgi:uncharacterized protein